MQSGPGVEISMDSVQLEAKKQDVMKKLPRYLILQVRSNRWVWIGILSVDLHDELYMSYFSILFLQIACGLDHTLLLSTDGTVMSCGWGADGQTGTVYNSTINALFHCSNVKHVQV